MWQHLLWILLCQFKVEEIYLFIYIYRTLWLIKRNTKHQKNITESSFSTNSDRLTYYSNWETRQSSWSEEVFLNKDSFSFCVPSWGIWCWRDAVTFGANNSKLKSKMHRRVSDALHHPPEQRWRAGRLGYADYAPRTLSGCLRVW